MNRSARMLLLGLLTIPAPGVLAQGGAAPTVTVETSTTARRKIRLAEVYLERQDWSDAISLLRRTLDDHAGDLVQVSPGRFLETSSRINRLLVRMPPAALAVYREQVDPQARRWFESGRSENDTAVVSRILVEAYPSRWTDDALWWLGEQAWKTNRPRRAARYWQQLLPPARPADSPTTRRLEAGGRLGFPDSRHPEADVRTRLVLCHCLAGRLDLARIEWSRLKRRFPDARGTLAGQRGNLVALLADWIARPELWNNLSSPAPHITFGGAIDRNGNDAEPVDPGAPLWHASFDESLAAGPSHLTDRHPVIVDNLLFVASSFGVYGWNLKTGQPAWPADTATGTAASAHLVYPPGPAGPPVRAARQRSGHIVTSLVVAGERLYARVGSPVTAQAAREPRPLHHELVALDISGGEGRVVLQVSPTVIPVNDSRGRWSFDGTPLVLNDRLFVTTRRGHPQAELGIASLDADSGQLAWHRRLASAVTAADQTTNIVTHNLLASSNGQLLYSGDTGVVARLDPATGSVAWITSLDPPTGSGPFCTLADPDSDLLLVRTANDRLSALDFGDGHVAWSRRLPGRIDHLLGIRNGRAIVSGHSLWALNISSGRIAWQRLAREQHQHGLGRGLVASGIVYWPTRERLHLLDLDSGQPLRQPVRLDVRGCRGGNLVLSPRGLVICGENRVTVLGLHGGLLPNHQFDNPASLPRR